MSLVVSVEQKDELGQDGNWARVELKPTSSVFVDVYPDGTGAVFARGRVDTDEFLRRAFNEAFAETAQTRVILSNDDTTWHQQPTLGELWDRLRQTGDLNEHPDIDASDPPPEIRFIAIDGDQFAISWERRAEYGYRQTEITVRANGPVVTEFETVLDTYLGWTIPTAQDTDPFWGAVQDLLDWEGPPFDTVTPTQLEDGVFRNITLFPATPDPITESLLAATEIAYREGGDVYIGARRVGKVLGQQDVAMLLIAEDTINGDVLRAALRLARANDVPWAIIESGAALGERVGSEDPVGIVAIREPGPAQQRLAAAIDSLRDAHKERFPTPMIEN